jgi:hypothetical protein
MLVLAPTRELALQVRAGGGIGVNHCAHDFANQWTLHDCRLIKLRPRRGGPGC